MELITLFAALGLNDSFNILMRSFFGNGIIDLNNTVIVQVCKRCALIVGIEFSEISIYYYDFEL